MLLQIFLSFKKNTEIKYSLKIPCVAQHFLIAHSVRSGLELLLPTPGRPSALPSPCWQSLPCSLFLWVCCFFARVTSLFLDPSIGGGVYICVYMQICPMHHIYLSFSVWLISFSIMLSKSIHVVADDKTSRFILAESYFIVSVYVLRLLYPPLLDT